MSGVSISGASADAQVCRNGVCTTLDATGPKSRPFAHFEDVHEGDAKHVLTVDGVRYGGPISFKKLLPNGPQCSPRCYQASFVFTGRELVPLSE